MQQVEGSSPFSRFERPRSGGAFLCPALPRACRDQIARAGCVSSPPPGSAAGPQDLLRAANARPKSSRIASGAIRKPTKNVANPSSESSTMPIVAKVLPRCGGLPVEPSAPDGVSLTAGLSGTGGVDRP
jgi:hypothetical protein